MLPFELYDLDHKKQITFRFSLEVKERLRPCSLSFIARTTNSPWLASLACRFVF